VFATDDEEEIRYEESIWSKEKHHLVAAEIVGSRQEVIRGDAETHHRSRNNIYIRHGDDGHHDTLMSSKYYYFDTTHRSRATKNNSL
jgi:hypothetical protein